MPEQEQQNLTTFPGLCPDSRFIAINQTHGPLGCVPRLALVDAALAEDLTSVRWKTTPTGHVYRQYYHRELSATEHRQVVLSESMGARVLGVSLDANSNVYPISGDKLDLRRSNLTQEPNEARRQPVVAGSTFNSLPAFLEASLLRTKNDAKIAALYPAGRRTTRLTSLQIQKILNEIAANDGGVFDDRTLAWVRDNYVEPEFGERISLSRLRAIVYGLQQRQPGFDAQYQKIREVIPTRADGRLKRLRALSGA